jgi:hypothetical protein
MTEPGPPWREPGPWQQQPEPRYQHGPVLVTIGDMAITQAHVITPTGFIPLIGTTWLVQENVQSTSGIPTWAIVMAILLFLFCLLGLLFLLVKEERTTGWVQVSVQAPGAFHATQIPVNHPLQIGAIHQQVNYVRSLVAMTGR